MTVIRVESIDRDLIERYLPENSYVTQVWEQSGHTTVEGEDDHGWTAEDYVIPRLGSGLIAAKVTSVLSFDIDEAQHYFGDEDDGCYVYAAQYRGKWHVDVVVDCNTSSFTDTLLNGDGPYENEQDAVSAGEGVARQWCFDNEVDPDPVEGSDKGDGIEY